MFQCEKYLSHVVAQSCRSQRKPTHISVILLTLSSNCYFSTLWNTHPGIYSLLWSLRLKIASGLFANYVSFGLCSMKPDSYSGHFESICVSLRHKQIKSLANETWKVFVCLSLQRFHVSKCWWWCPVIFGPSGCRLAPLGAQWHQLSGHKVQRRPVFNQQQLLIQHHKDKQCTSRNTQTVQNVFSGPFCAAIGQFGGVSCVMQ